jgi:ABC-type transport system substrate-binding protein
VTIDLPNPKTAAGTVTVAVGDVAPNPGINRSQGGEGDVYWGASETLFMTRKGPVFGEPWLAKSWTVATDLSKVTIKIQEGVQFHKGYGELTATDVAWSINDANARTNPQSIHAQAGDLSPVFNEWKAVDKYTIDAPFVTFDPRWQTNGLSDGWQPTAVFSKKVYDEKGADFMRANIIATGSFEVREWTADKRAILDAVKSHWRQLPKIQTIQYLEIPDSAIRLAGMQTGEFDAGTIELKDIKGLVAKGFKTTGTSSGSEVNIAFAGNLWEKNHAVTGAALTRVGLDTTKPWIGDPDNADSMERARKVRWALAMGYDRAQLSESLTAGLAWPTGIGYFNPNMPQFQSKWAVPYDVAAAKQLLKDAGYPSGFEIEIFGQSDTQIRAETAEAVAGYWQSQLGLKVKVQSFAYRVFRPSIVNREAKIPFVNSCDDGRFPRPWDWPVATTMTSLTRGGFSCALESPFIVQSWLKASKEPDIQKRVEINNQVADYMHNWMLSPSTFTIPVLIVFNPKKIESWEMRPSLSGPITSAENIVPAK